MNDNIGSSRRWITDSVYACVVGFLLTLVTLTALATYGITRERALDVPGFISVRFDAYGGFVVTGGSLIPVVVVGIALVALFILRVLRRT